MKAAQACAHVSKLKDASEKDVGRSLRVLRREAHVLIGLIPYCPNSVKISEDY